MPSASAKLLPVDGSRPGSAATMLTADEEEQFAHDLGLMLRAGLRLSEALQALGEREGGNPRMWLPQLQESLRQGQSFSRALQGSGGFGLSLIACVSASEATGSLADSLERFAANARRLRELRARIVSAGVYPLLLVVVATLVVLFLLVYVVPRFAVVLEGAGADMPAMSRVLIAVGTGMHAVQAPLLAALAAAAAAAGVWLWRAARSRRLGAWFVDRLAGAPGAAAYVHAYGLAQLARSGAMLVRAGIPALKALQMCRELLPAVDRTRLDRALDAASFGAPLAHSLHDAGLLDAVDYRVLKVAQQTGQLEAALERLADLHDDTLARGLDRITRLIEPMLMLVIGTVVGGIVVLMYLPIFQLAASIR